MYRDLHCHKIVSIESFLSVLRVLEIKRNEGYEPSGTFYNCLVNTIHLYRQAPIHTDHRSRYKSSLLTRQKQIKIRHIISCAEPLQWYFFSH